LIDIKINFSKLVKLELLSELCASCLASKLTFCSRKNI